MRPTRRPHEVRVVMKVTAKTRVEVVHTRKPGVVSRNSERGAREVATDRTVSGTGKGLI